MDQLIAAVRNYPALYDTYHNEYMNSKAKLNIWEHIAAQVGFRSGISAKNAWLKLRNCHRDAIRRQRRMKRRGGPSNVTLKNWKYQKQMEFLMPYMLDRQTKLGKNSTNDPVLQDGMSNKESDITFDNSRTIFKSEITYPEEDCGNEDPDYIDAGVLLNQSQETNENKTQEGSVKKIEQNKEIQHQDPLYHFFMSMYESTRRMPMQSQHKVRLQIFNLISNTEAEIYNLTSYNE